ncbi:glycosyltransferase family 4 protein [Cesiribacter andamanensis]|uniref:Mannosylfructose-phosphate synthase n=1 Tax=Cesiribacter andamanensis AMV16 TaxID=1279009 RepID=M7N6R5_9BACT|nr:glycosyltransferase family 4 protein [Cesiribacter andamanensis]EMR02977.1 Mannosylfructose-phosphate synthase [Cesiribacter andamanensis AMV16]
MKVAHIIHELGQGGAQKFVVDWVNTALELGIEPILIVYNLDQQHSFFLDKVHPSVKLIDLNINFSSVRKHVDPIIRLHRVLREQSPDIVNTHLWPIDHLFFIRRFLPSCKYFHTLHNQPVKERGRHLHSYWIRNYFFKNKTVYPVAISKDVLEGYHALYGAQAPYYLVPNGSSKPQPTPRLQQVMQEIEDLKPTPATTVFLSIGRIATVKNYQLAVDAFQQLHQEGKECLLLVIGGDGSPLAPQPLSYFKSLDTPNVHFLGLRSNVSDYLAAADFYCMFSHYEGLSIAQAEAMAMQLISVVTPGPGVSEPIQEGENGFISPSYTVSDYVDTLQNALQLSKAERKRMEEVTLRKYEQEFSMQKCVGAYLSAYKEQLQKK